MERNLRRHMIGVWHYVNDAHVEGAPSCVRGDLSGVTGDLSGVRGDLDDCAISDDDRVRGVNIEDLIAAEPETHAVSV